MDANSDCDDLVKKLQALDLAKVALPAQIDPAGHLSPVGDLWPKLLAAAKESAPVGLIETIIVAEDQKNVPLHLETEFAHPLRVRRAATLQKAVDILHKIAITGPIDDLPHLLVGRINELFWAIRKREYPDPDFSVEDLSELCKLCSRRRPTDEQEKEKEIDWIDYIVRCVAFLEKDGRRLKPEETDILVQYCESKWRFGDELWALERKALFLEMLKRFEEAGQLSEECAKRAQKDNRLAPFVAALHARAAECFKQAGEEYQLRAAENFAAAADLLARDKRLSRKALEYYKAASDLTPEAPDHRRLKEAADNLRKTLDAKEESAHFTVAIFSNLPDADFADLLVDPLLKAKIACIFRDSAEVDDLAGLHSCCDAIIVVGGIRAHETGFLVHEHFYDDKPLFQLYEEESVRQPVTFRSVDIEGRRYCGVWYKKIADRPAYVLAGTVREETCRAVLAFIGSDHFTKFVKSLHGGDAR